MGQGGGQPNISQEMIRQIRICVPPTLEEQQAIVEYLDRETEHMATLRSTLEAQINTLRLHRQTLITAAVTGRIDVRGLAA